MTSADYITFTAHNRLLLKLRRVLFYKSDCVCVFPQGDQLRNSQKGCWCNMENDSLQKHKCLYVQYAYCIYVQL